MSVYGPPGVEEVVAGFNEAYALDADYRTAHHGANFLPPDAAAMIAMPVPIPRRAATALVLDEDGLKITAIRVHHDPAKPAYGYRFDYHGPQRRHQRRHHAGRRSGARGARAATFWCMKACSPKWWPHSAMR